MVGFLLIGGITDNWIVNLCRIKGIFDIGIKTFKMKKIIFLFLILFCGKQNYTLCQDTLVLKVKLLFIDSTELGVNSHISSNNSYLALFLSYDSLLCHSHIVVSVPKAISMKKNEVYNIRIERTSVKLSAGAEEILNLPTKYYPFILKASPYIYYKMIEIIK